MSDVIASLKYAHEVVLHGGYDEQTRGGVLSTLREAVTQLNAERARSEALRKALVLAQAECWRPELCLCHVCEAVRADDAARMPKADDCIPKANDAARVTGEWE
jgi:hypothetical protein